ncbi:maltase-glucoamylase-like [Paramacrobiotus metropolitanus]|uniref:maltase-glucoamylase-like n=1 Tax=Paramacrobiotus metropolitanus TaxID=2943436 RepID=UPI002445F742|nr:maltase-glucoamylase-like [Paramacrobiotus metropolitanus]
MMVPVVLFLALASIPYATAESRADGDVQLACTLDSFHLKIKQSSCSCTCDGAPVSPTELAATVPTTPAVRTTPEIPTTTPVAPINPGSGVTCATQPNENLAPVEADDFDRVDCYPDWGASEAGCVARGCIWQPSQYPNGQSTGAPWCFHPGSNVPKAYNSNGCAAAADKATFALTKAYTGNSFSTPWADVRVDIEHVGKSVLRIKYYDAGRSRYEVPTPINRPPPSTTTTDYEVRVYQEPYFYFKVIRRSTGTVLFDTSLAGLILEDQYIQIKTKLPSEKIFGFGENRHRTFKHNLNVGAVPMWTKDSPPGYENGNHYGFHPYYMVVEDNDGRAHGVLLHTSSGMEYKFAPGPTLTLKLIGGILDFYFVLGDNPEEVTQQYTALVGRPFLPPYWSLGFQLSRWGYNSLTKLQQIINRNRMAGVPQDVQTLDIDYMRFRQNFVIDHDNYNGLGAYVDQLKRDGIRAVIILDPAIHSDAPIKHPKDPQYLPYDNGVMQDVFIKWPHGVTGIDSINVGPNNILLGKVWPDGRAAFPDFFSEKAKTWWKNEIVKQHQTLKFDGLWIDMNEPASFGTNTNGQGQWFCGGDLPGNHTCQGLRCPQNSLEQPPYTGRLGRLSDNTICMSTEQECRPGQRCTHYDVHNLYGWSQSEPTFAAGQEATGKRILVVSRSTYPGNGQHVGHWLGDNSANWGDLQYSIVGMLEFNIFGIPYIGADICGFFNEPSEELCARWQQVGAFYPYARNHNGNHYKDQDPAQWPLVADVTKKALAIRYRLLPYLYTLFYHAHTTGSTVIRPLHHEFLTDQTTYDINDQFLWGAGLMISPVVQDGWRSRSVYFPDAKWYDYAGTPEVTRQGSRTLPMEIDQIGMHYRGGIIFPAQVPGKNTAESRRNPFQFIVALNDTYAANGDLYWDDGEAIDAISGGKHLRASMKFRQNAPHQCTFTYTVDASANVNSGNVIVRDIHLFGMPFAVVRAEASRGFAHVIKVGQAYQVVLQDIPLNASFHVSLFPTL